VVRIVIECPGADVTVMDERVTYPLLVEINGAPDLSSVDAVSCAERSELYVSVERNRAVDDIMQRIHRTLPDLPTDCRVGTPEEMPPSFTIPSPGSDCIARDLMGKRIPPPAAE